NLSRYVDEAREVGATPVLVTSLSRRLWAPDGVHIASILTDYVEATRSVAKEKSVPLVDLHARSIEIYESLGQAGCEEISPQRTDNGGLDRTHLNEAGSLLFGPIVAQELQKVLPSAGEFLRKEKTTESRCCPVQK
ncbi:MAG: hypothetical protein KDA80_13225, partial [Planctomycetaceae bacterium]|nr:hypothetical protein [Planctomycetaceae bacterium]